MPTPQRTFKAVVLTDTPTGTNTETVAATLSGVSTQSADARVFLRGWGLLVVGASTTQVVVQIRRTGLGGVLVGEANNITPVVGAFVNLDCEAVDTPGEIASGVYVFTITQLSGTVAGTITTAALEAVTG